MLSFFRSTVKREAPQQPQPAHIQHCAAKSSTLKFTLASQPLRSGSTLSIKPRYWSFSLPSSRSAFIPTPQASSNKLALLFGKGRQQEEDEEKKEGDVSKQASKGHISVYLRFVLVGNHRALAKAKSQTQALRLGEDRASYLWRGKQAIQLAIPKAATRFLSGNLSLVMEAFQQGLDGKMDVMLARGVVHHFMEHLQKAEAPRVLVLPLVSTSPLIDNSSRITTSKGLRKHDNQEARSEACIRLAYLPLAPPCQCRIMNVEGEANAGTSDKTQRGGIGKEGVNERISGGKEEGKNKRVTTVDDVMKDEGGFSRKTPPEFESEASVRVREQREKQEEEDEAPKMPAEDDARVSSVGSNFHLDLATSFIEQIWHEQESDAPPVRTPREEVVRSSEQEEDDKVVEALARVDVEVPEFRTPSLKLASQAEMVAHCEAASATEQGRGGRTTALAVLQENRAAGNNIPPPVGGGRRRRIHKSVASTARRKAQLVRINKLLADLETLPLTLKNGEWIR